MCNFICPKCKSDCHTGCNSGTMTAMYFQPIYKDGVNINPDRNIYTCYIKCLHCNRVYSVKTQNGEKTIKFIRKDKPIKTIKSNNLTKCTVTDGTNAINLSKL